MQYPQRHALVRSTLDALLRLGRFPDFVIFENADRPDDHAQVSVAESGALHAQIGAQHMNEPLPDDVANAATLLVGALDSAFAQPGADLVVKTNAVHLQEHLQTLGLWVADAPRAPALEQFDLDMVRSALVARGWRVLHDEATDALMTFWDWDDEMAQGVQVYFAVQGDCPFHVLAVHARGSEPVRDAQHPRILELLNQWNATHRWPSVWLESDDGEQLCWLHGDWYMPIRAAVCSELIDDVVEAVTANALDFFRWLHERTTTGIKQRSHRPSGTTC
ncbi:MAG: YbjN domain-containing protein [Candidatus Dormibacteraeota bacterium]|nr:YbjN domain-containing protein [Candidatus Dormibacteraeota bacterium]